MGVQIQKWNDLLRINIYFEIKDTTLTFLSEITGFVWVLALQILTDLIFTFIVSEYHKPYWESQVKLDVSEV